MLIKFTQHGKGCARKAAAYLLDDKDHQNNLRAGIEVLSGDPLIFSAICEASKHKWKYTSAVIAFAPEDNPSPKQISQVLNTFEKYAFAGLNPQRYHMLAVLHTEEDGSKHIHVLTPRIDLETKRSLNIAPPGHHKYFDSLRDYFNYKNGWARPDDPARMKDTQEPNYVYLQRAAAIAAVLKKESRKTIQQQLDEFLKIHISAGLIKDHQDIIQALQSIKSITEVSVSKNAKTPYIAIKIEGHDRSIRLKGPLYESEFHLELYLAARTTKSSTVTVPTGLRDATTEHSLLAEQARQRVRELYQQRKQYNDRIYSQPRTDSTKDSTNSQHSSTRSERDSKNADELTGSWQQQSGDRGNKTADTQIPQRYYLSTRSSSAGSETTTGQISESDQRPYNKLSANNTREIYWDNCFINMSYSDLLHVLCKSKSLHHNSGAQSAQYYYCGEAFRTRKISLSNPSSADSAFKYEQEVDDEQKRTRYLVAQAHGASNQAKSVVDRAKQDATGGKYNGEETERQIEHYIQRSTQIRDFIGSKKQHTRAREYSAVRKNPEDTELSAATTILRELAAKFTTAIGTAYAAITRKFGFNGHDFFKSEISDTSNHHSRDSHSDTTTSIQIAAGIPSLTSSDKTALIKIKSTKELQLQASNKPVNQSTMSTSSDFDM